MTKKVRYKLDKIVSLACQRGFFSSALMGVSRALKKNCSNGLSSV